MKATIQESQISIKSKPKFIFVSGGVISGIGKGVTTASIALLLKRQGYKVCIVKCENYLNIDSGTINPIEHGDPFLTQDGLEADMDLGTYERFLDEEMGFRNFITLGQVYKSVIDRERAFGYEGKTLEPVEVISREIISRIKKSQEETDADIVVIELGGTAGEYQNIMYYESSRIMQYRFKDQVIHVHVAYAPIPNHLGEPKSKPIQLSVKTLNGMGIQPNFIVVRSEQLFDEKRREKLSMYCNLDAEDIIANPDLETIYELPLIFNEQGFSEKILDKLNLKSKKLDLTDWKKLIEKIKSPKSKSTTVAIVGKYFATGDYALLDSYASLLESIKHAGWNLDTQVNLKFINSEKQEKEIEELLKDVDGIIVPIGWGARGAEGKIKAIKYARENKVPYLGLCYGMQLACVEFARDVLKLKDANTTENDADTKYPIIHLIPEEEKYVRIKSKGVAMRLGGYDCLVKKGTLTSTIYGGAEKVSERHRHRFEFNNEFREQFEKAGFVFSGTSPDNFFVEMIELPQNVHPFFVATQAHPEYKSTPLKPHPMFVEFIKATQKG